MLWWLGVLATAAAAPDGPGGGPVAPAVARSAPGSFHAVAEVTDSRSHGLVGDGLLSLNEAIQLHNGTLQYAQLSPGEQATIQLIPGTGTNLSIAWVDIDGSSVPTITIERDLDPILDTPFGLLLRGFNDAPVLDFTGPGIQHGLRIPANSVALQDLVLFGGPYGADVTQTDVTGQAGFTMRRVRCEGQSQFGVRVTAATAYGVGRWIAGDCVFVGCPVAMDWRETGAFRTTIVELFGVAVTGAQTACRLELGAGGTGRYTFDRIDFTASAAGLVFSRPNGADRSALIESTHARIRAPLGAAIAAAQTGVTFTTLRMWDVRAGSGGTALQIGAPGAALYGDIEDCTLVGDVQVAGGGIAAPLALTNVRCRNGAVTLATAPLQSLSVRDTRFDQCAVTTAGSGPVVLQGCCLLGGSLVGTPTAPVQASGCHLATFGAHVQASASLPLPQLGSLELVPDVVTVGSSVTFQVDLPAGLFGVMLLGFTDPAPVLLPQPFHLYTRPGLAFTLPGLYRLQQGYVWPIPNVPTFAGFDFVVQMAALPDPGLAAPAVQLPPGRRFVLR
jgi:hypothetical protein